MKDIYRGSLVRLANDSPEIMAKAFVKWDRDTEQHRLADSDPAMLFSEKKIKDFIEKRAGKNPQAFPFSIRTLADDKLIGGVSLWVNSWTHADTWVGISIGEREYWGKGYGTEATRLMLDYAFATLDLHSVMLRVYAYNLAGYRAYLKAGFRECGRRRQCKHMGGALWDVIYMECLASEFVQG